MLLVYTNVIQMLTVKTQKGVTLVPVKKAMLGMASPVKVCVCVSAFLHVVYVSV